MTKTPEMKIVAHVSVGTGPSAYVHRSMIRVVWEDANFHYHVNLMNDGSMPLPDEKGESKYNRSAVIHRNAKDETIRYPMSHTTLNLYASTHEAIRAAILALATAENVEAAYAAAEAEARAKEAAEKKAASDALRAAVEHQCEVLRLVGKELQAACIFEAFKNLDDDQVRCFAAGLRAV
jgi:hypothetical protein